MTTDLAIPVETDSTRDAASEPPVVTVYTAGTACVQCALTEKVLAELGILSLPLSEPLPEPESSPRPS